MDKPNISKAVFGQKKTAYWLENQGGFVRQTKKKLKSCLC